MQRLMTASTTSTLGVAVIALIFGFALGRGLPLVGATGASQGQTPTAAACPPSPTASPIAAPSPVAAGTPLPYGEDWTVAATGITALAVPIPGNEPEGVFVMVYLTITNERAETRLFPFDDFLLLDEQGRSFLVSTTPSTYAPNLMPELHGIHYFFSPSLPTQTALVFDVATNAGDTFLLQSRSDPTFQVRLDIQLRGNLDEAAPQ